jgi:hypothetical protein
LSLSNPESVVQTAPPGLIGSHRHFARNWSACFASAPRLGGFARYRARPLEPAADAYLLAGRSLAEWSGRPLLDEGIVERTPIPPAYTLSFILPPTRIAAPADVTRCVQSVMAERQRMPDFWSGCREVVLPTLATLLSEMAQNICEHSRGRGCVAICWHDGGRRDRSLLSIGIVDVGIGIRKSITDRLRAAGLADDLSDAEAIARAFELPYPTNVRDRGTGLRMSRDLIQRFHGVMHVRSGSAVVSTGPSSRLLVSRCSPRQAPVPGTQLSIHLAPPTV